MELLRSPPALWSSWTNDALAYLVDAPILIPPTQIPDDQTEHEMKELFARLTSTVYYDRDALVDDLCLKTREDQQNHQENHQDKEENQENQDQQNQEGQDDHVENHVNHNHVNHQDHDYLEEDQEEKEEKEEKDEKGEFRLRLEGLGFRRVPRNTKFKRNRKSKLYYYYSPSGLVYNSIKHAYAGIKTGRF